MLKGAGLPKFGFYPIGFKRSISNIIQSLPWTPSELTTSLWLDASDISTITQSSGSVSAWNDKSGNDNHAIQSTSAEQPVVSNINGVNSLSFDGFNDGLVFSQIDSYLKTIFVVAQRNSIGTNDCILSNVTVNHQVRISDANNVQVTGEHPYWGAGTDTVTIIDNNNPFVLGYELDLSLKFSLNGTLNNTSRTSDGDGDANVNQIGKRQSSSEPFDGKIGELIIFDSILSELDRQKVEGYLAHKWGLEDDLPSDHPYKSAPPTV